MPVFHTKTIESILDPVAQQVRNNRKFILIKLINQNNVKWHENEMTFQICGYGEYLIVYL